MSTVKYVDVHGERVLETGKTVKLGSNSAGIYGAWEMIASLSPALRKRTITPEQATELLAVQHNPTARPRHGMKPVRVVEPDAVMQPA